jgi:long-chain acyl-CoA synthetase
LRSFLSRAAQVIPLDPDRELAAALDTARELLHQGYSIVWFPEGRRSPTGELGRFHHGIGLLLGDSGARAVPTAIEGSFAAWPKHRRWPRSGSLSVTFGTRLRATAASSASAALESAVRELLDTDRRLAAERPRPLGMNAGERRSRVPSSGIGLRTMHRPRRAPP